MLSGLEFLRLVFGTPKPDLNSYGSSYFGDIQRESTPEFPDVFKILDFGTFGTNPRPAPKPDVTPAPKLYHPRPVFRAAFEDALERFEEVSSINPSLAVSI